MEKQEVNYNNAKEGKRFTIIIFSTWQIQYLIESNIYSFYFKTSSQF